uniref:RCC1-like domain-containing protein n=1 Tax=Palpitomonas bilix TaxID=652834 RepID=A0A7S3DGT7_9EUKA|mmetsp:Transcript_36874/g.95487  ORF Transcript_36874/g.95487 Transcript_36874/m.95487 type:complete len:418 (+) Transcript_36874:159-1412(+)|eukprot:CAMPEP_0113872204 /NCGR_PEP_ID=MMETSP0780_2-20120614/3073_1 /TAXON_ID=652834 /ORGANISM="Palpitomonas bilix" /LENGTH=417 /DNA_ID=CAMNT_0000857689 /DNA_START=65 /DNA_END=1318 /DNA_ORIENTATION=+ /assembly_acc=CAM_ASM_000599
MIGIVGRQGRLSTLFSRLYTTTAASSSPSRYSVGYWGRVSRDYPVQWVPSVLNVDGRTHFDQQPTAVCGNYHSGVVVASEGGEGTLYLFGKDEAGRLGTNSADEGIPRPVEALRGCVLSTSLGGLHSSAIVREGGGSEGTPCLYMWGHNGFGQLGFEDSTLEKVPRPLRFENLHPVEVVCGGSHTLVKVSNGDVVSFGRGDNGRLGVGNFESYPFPVKVDTEDPCRRKRASNNFISLSAGGFHSLAANDAGEVLSWGGGKNGELGRKSEMSGNDPYPNFIPSTLKGGLGRMKKVAAGGFHSALLTTDGDLYMFGLNKYGQLGMEREEAVLTPTKLELDEKIADVALGSMHTVAITESGRLIGCGVNLMGELAKGEKTEKIVNMTEIDITSLSEGELKAVSVSAGSNSTFVVVKEVEG